MIRPCGWGNSLNNKIPCKILNYKVFIFNLSGREDLNFRPLAPHASALANCATPRGLQIYNNFSDKKYININRLKTNISVYLFQNNQVLATTYYQTNTVVRLNRHRVVRDFGISNYTTIPSPVPGLRSTLFRNRQRVTTFSPPACR